MPRVELIGDFVKETFVLPFQPGRIRWNEETKSLDRLGGVFLTKALLSGCYPDVVLGHDCLPEDPSECRPRRETRSQIDFTFYSQLFELDPGSRLTVRVLQRRLLPGRQQWSISGQLSRLYKYPASDKYVLFVEQEEYTGLPRSEETQKLFEFVRGAPVSALLLKTNQPLAVLESARAADQTKPTIVLTTLRALNGHSLHNHTWDAAVHHVLRELGNFPGWMRVGVELWNEGCVWVHGFSGLPVLGHGAPARRAAVPWKGLGPGVNERHLRISALARG